MAARPGLLRAALLALALGGGAVAAVEGCPAPDPKADEWEAQRQWQAIERAGYRIGRIEVEVTDVYESDEAWYAAAANWLHVETREGVIRDRILVEPGEALEANVIYESARALRDLGFFREVSIQPLRCRDGQVDVLVTALDAWTLLVSVRANRAGGQNDTGFRIEDRNFLGTGKEIYFEYEDDGTRTSSNYSYIDRAVLGSRWRASLLHEDRSDGKFDDLGVALPFLSTKQTWGFEGGIADRAETLTFYQSGEVAWQAPATTRRTSATVWRLVTRQGRAGWRVGFGARTETRTYGAAVPVDPSLRPAPDLAPFDDDGIVLAVERFHDSYASFRDLRLVDKTEDVNLGLDAALSIAFDPNGSSLGGADGTRFGLASRWAGRPREGWLLEAELDASARNAQDEWRDGYASGWVALYARHGRHTRLARLGLDWRDRPDPEHEAILGGEDGMLGYPANWVVGDRMARLHLEDRWTTDQVLFQTLRVGYAVIGEVGRGRRFGGQWSKTLANLGAGFRLGNLRGAYGQVLYFSVFVPLVKEPGVDSYQVVIGDVIPF